MAIFQFFKTAAVRHLGFFKMKFCSCLGLRGLKCVIVPNFTAIRWTVAELWRFNVCFSKWRHPPCCTSKTGICNRVYGSGANMRHCAKFRLIGCWDKTIFLFFSKCRLSAILDLLRACSIRTNQCPPPPPPYFYRLDALPAAQPTASKHWRQLAHSN